MISPGQIRQRETFIEWVLRFLAANKRTLQSGKRAQLSRKTLARKTA
jgi:hypothetical protein